MSVFYIVSDIPVTILYIRLRVRMVKSSTLTVGNFFKSGKSECNNSGYKLTGLTWWP